MDSLELENRLKHTFTDCEAVVLDMTGAGSNFEIRLSTPELKDLSRLERHQRIMAIFAHELKTGEIHALTIKYI